MTFRICGQTKAYKEEHLKICEDCRSTSPCPHTHAEELFHERSFAYRWELLFMIYLFIYLFIVYYSLNNFFVHVTSHNSIFLQHSPHKRWDKLYWFPIRWCQNAPHHPFFFMFIMIIVRWTIIHLKGPFDPVLPPPPY